MVKKHTLIMHCEVFSSDKPTIVLEKETKMQIVSHFIPNESFVITTPRRKMLQVLNGPNTAININSATCDL